MQSSHLSCATVVSVFLSLQPNCISWICSDGLIQGALRPFIIQTSVFFLILKLTKSIQTKRENNKEETKCVPVDQVYQEML